jgi:SAM-dependent methyltransferase
MSGQTGDIYGLPPSRPDDYDAMRLDVIRRRWDEKAQRWDADLAGCDCHLNEDGAYQRFLEAADAVVTDRAEFCRRQLLVDLGCATGLVLAHFIDRFAEGLGVDISPRMLEMAARRRLPRTRLAVANGFELASQVSKAGAVLSRGILLSHYGPHWAPVLMQQVRRALIPGGFALLDFLNAAARDTYPVNPDNKAYYQAEQMESLGKEAGFQQVTILGEPQRRVLLMLAELS